MFLQPGWPLCGEGTSFSSILCKDIRSGRNRKGAAWMTSANTTGEIPVRRKA